MTIDGNLKERAYWRRLLAWSAAALVLVLSPQAAFAERENVAGRVSFVIGEAYITRSTEVAAAERHGLGKAGRVLRGADIYAGDLIETMAGGHVHIRFVDEGLVSVRPNSHFSVDYYDYKVAKPSESVIRFNLLEGQVRSISGAGAKAARDKFRLNTPIAAIGVRGTDFVVDARDLAIQAVVNEGAIVVAPFSASCASDGMGRCDVGAVELRGDTQQILKFSSLHNQPQLVSVVDGFIPELMKKQTEEVDLLDAQGGELQPEDEADGSSGEADGSSGGADGSSGGAEGSSDEAATQKQGAASEESIGNDGLGGVIDEIDSLSDASPWDVNETEVSDQVAAASAPDKSVDVPKPTDYVPALPVSVAELNERQLVWGRWGSGDETDRLIVSRGEITGARSVAVGNGDFVLYRSDSDLSNLKAGLGSVSFDLVDAQASLTGEHSVDAMQVKDGWLNIDFSARSFSTGVKLNHYKTSDMTVSYEGSINSQGYFNSRSDDARLVGATTLDGAEASYWFSQQIELGTVEGITFWKGEVK